MDKEITIHFKLGSYTLISYEKKYIGTEYVIALNYNSETKSWDSGTYTTSFEHALAIMLLKNNSKLVKQPYQVECENKSEMTYERLTELATLFKDGLIEDDRETAMEYFEETCEMTEQEMEFFGIENEEEEEDEE